MLYRVLCVNRSTYNKPPCIRQNQSLASLILLIHANTANSWILKSPIFYSINMTLPPVQTGVTLDATNATSQNIYQQAGCFQATRP